MIKIRNVLFGILGLTAFSSMSFADDMPVDRVILSTSGLANFELRAHVEGDQALEFPVRLQQVDDVLKSLVVFDPSGQIGSVTLPGKQSLDEIFKDLPFTRDQLSNPVALLNAYQGATLTVKNASGSITGKILHVLPEKVFRDDKQSVMRNRLTLMTADGVRQVIVEDLQSMNFADARVRSEIDRALQAVRDNSASDRRMLTVQLAGKGARDVALAYVVDAPLWKTAYRMVVPDASKDKGLLQGWAVVENMTANDWKNVDLTLVSGNPVTYRQSLYQSYYVSRPEIPVQVFGRVMPRVDQGALTSAASAEGAGAEMGAIEQKSFMAPAAPAMMRGVAAKAVVGNVAMAMEAADMASPAMQTGMDSVAAMAHASESAEATTQVLFRFPDRFTLMSGQSMMLPFVSRAVPMARVSLYQPETHPTHPLAAVEISNEGDTGLPPGILTLYEDSALLKGTSFVGDAQMPMIGAGEKRLVSYALDSKTDISREDKSEATEGRVTISQGVMNTAVVNRLETVYTIKAPAKEARVIVIEQPKMGDYKIVSPDPKSVEVTDTHYRIRVPMKEGEKKTLSVVLENQSWNSMSIDGLSTDDLMAYASSRGNLPDETRQAFEKLARIRRDMDALDQQIAMIDQQKQQIFTDQARVRENLKSLDEKSDVKEKYLQKLNDQEDEIAKLDKQHEKLSADRQDVFVKLQAAIADIKL